MTEVVKIQEPSSTVAFGSKLSAVASVQPETTTGAGVGVGVGVGLGVGVATIHEPSSSVTRGS